MIYEEWPAPRERASAERAQRLPVATGSDCCSVKQRRWPAIADQHRQKGGKPVDKPGSVVDSHSSRRTVTSTLKRPTRKQREPRPCFPIWPCSGWGLPCRPCCHVRGELLPHRFTLTCPGLRRDIGGLFSVALSVTSRCPVVNRHLALWSPDFPLGARFAPLAQRLPDRLPAPIIPGSGCDRAGTATDRHSRRHFRSPA